MNQRGAASGEAIMILFIVLYILVIGWVARAMGTQFGYSAPALASMNGWALPYVNTGVSLINYFFDVIVFIINILGWIISSLASFVVLIGYSVKGDIPAWLMTLGFLPIGYAVVWMMINVLRGR